MTGHVSTAINCPQCGSPFDFHEGARNAVCASCGTALAIIGEAGIGRFYIEPKIDLNQARTSVRKILAAQGVEEGDVKNLRFEKGELCFLPFWSLRAHAAGWFWTERETVIKEEDIDENGVKSVRETRGPNQRSFETVAVDVKYSSPACDLSRFGLTGIATASAVLPLRVMNFEGVAGLGTLIDPVKGADQVRAEAVAQARNRGGGSRVLRQEGKMNLIGTRMALISYPVWDLTFSLNSRVRHVTVDAVNGRGLKGRFPAASSIRLAIPMLTVVAVVFAFSISQLLGVAVTAGLCAYLWNRGELSLPHLAGHLFLLVKRGKEVSIG